MQALLDDFVSECVYDTTIVFYAEAVPEMLLLPCRHPKIMHFSRLLNYHVVLSICAWSSQQLA